MLSANTLVYGQVGGVDSPMLRNMVYGNQPVKILIVYQSKYGSTKQYAEWICRETKGDLANVANGDRPDLAGYDIIIIGGYVRTGSIVIAPYIRDHWSVIKGKKVILFTTSGTPPGHPKLQGIYEKSLPEEIRKEIKYFPLPGRISVKDLTLFDRLLLSVGKIMEQDGELRKDMGKDFDGVQREKLLPLFQYLEGLQKTLSAGSNDDAEVREIGRSAEK